MQSIKPLIVALDVDNDDSAIKYVDRLKYLVDIFKVGPSLFMRYGERIIRRIHWRRKKVFLDLKFHDIPHTVESAVMAASKLGVYALSVHLAGGQEMLKRILSLENRPKIWGITVLTSIDQEEYSRMGLKDEVKDQVIRLARLGASCGVDGIVCSPREVSLLKKDTDIGKKGITLITPGIRPGDEVSGDDQKRAATPGSAKKNGADFIVVGRPILKSPTPDKTAAAINRELKSAVSSQ